MEELILCSRLKLFSEASLELAVYVVCMYVCMCVRVRMCVSVCVRICSVGCIGMCACV